MSAVVNFDILHLLGCISVFCLSQCAHIYSIIVCVWVSVQYTGDHCLEKWQMTDLNVKSLWAQRSLWHFHFGGVTSLPPRSPLSANVTDEELASAVDCLHLPLSRHFHIKENMQLLPSHLLRGVRWRKVSFISKKLRKNTSQGAGLVWWSDWISHLYPKLPFSGVTNKSVRFRLDSIIYHTSYERP